MSGSPLPVPASHKHASHLDIPVLVSRTLGDGREASTATPMDLGPTGGEPLTLVSLCAHVRLPIPASRVFPSHMCRVGDGREGTTPMDVDTHAATEFEGELPPLTPFAPAD